MKENHTLLLLRHGHTKPEAFWRYTGQREVDLTDTGRQQARQWADCLAGTQVTEIYTSPLKRCLETANLIAEKLKCPVKLRGDLKEIALGEWEGLSRKTVEKFYPGAYAERGKNMDSFRPPGGESFQDLLQRVVPFAETSLASRQQTLAVTHAGIIRVLCCWAMQKPVDQLFDFHPHPGRLAVIQRNRSGTHLAATALRHEHYCRHDPKQP